MANLAIPNGIVALMKFLMSVNIIFSAANLPEYCQSPYDSIPMLKIPSTSSLSADSIHLRHVSLMIRHGDRIVASAGECWPNDNAVYNCTDSSQVIAPDSNRYANSYPTQLFRTVYKNGSNIFLGNCALGQMTHLGRLQHNKNGNMLRSAYIKSGFLAEDYDETQIELRADNFQRTIQSLHELVSTLYPTKKSAKSPQIFDVVSMDLINDNLYPQFSMCPNGLKNQAASLLSDKYKNFKEEIHEPLLQEFRNITGTNLKQVNSMDKLFDCMSVHICHRQDLPQGISMEMYNKIASANTLLWYITKFYPDVQTGVKLGIGFLLREILEEMRGHIGGESGKRMRIYSAHDTTVMPMLVALDVWDQKWTPYASMLHMELYEDEAVKKSKKNKEEGWYVRFVYNGRVLEAQWCGKGELCAFGLFAERVEAMTSHDLQEDCF
eukprot:TRINITY_DN6364_c0_g1_i1.p1 TRINITY_DN6364_c0_g1~~TRINITY_DN6364_c0_g1_i1.p1  ORF type:complete len:437 (+),score=84.81 TRINITY_DN6364_c0_g1_i1:41-1351(+)